MSLSKRMNRAMAFLKDLKNNACIRLHHLSDVSITTGRDKDKRFRTVEDLQMDSWFAHNLTKLSVLIASFKGSACI